MATARAENIASDENSMVMKREELNHTDTITNRINGAIVAAAVVIAIVGLLLLIRRRRRWKEK